MNDSSLTVYYLLDLDRTIFDTVKSTKLMEGVIALHNAGLAALLAQRFEEAEQLGESFSMRDFVVEQIGEEEMMKIEVKYKAAAAELDLLLPGAKELMSYIDAQPGVSSGILTYGSMLGQTMKIQAGGLGHKMVLVTGETFKGALISTWRQDDDLYHLPDELGGGTARTIVMIDDKPFSFKGLPIDCRGYLVKSVYDAGIEKLPLSVQPVSDLSEVLIAEKQRV